MSERDVITIDLRAADRRHQEIDKEIEAFDKFFRDQSELIMAAPKPEDV